MSEQKIVEGVATSQEDDSAPAPEDKSIVVATELLPETLLIIPLYGRPLFPKMMSPILVEVEGEKETRRENQSQWIQLLSSKRTTVRVLAAGLAFQLERRPARANLDLLSLEV